MENPWISECSAAVLFTDSTYPANYIFVLFESSAQVREAEKRIAKLTEEVY